MPKYPLKFSHISTGFLAVLVGYSSSVAIIFHTVDATGADQTMINSWLLALGLGMGITSIGLSFYFKTPILTAWSTPGAALLITSLNGVAMSDAVGAFLLSSTLITLSGITGSFERLNKIVSPAITAAMLAGVMLPFCLEIFKHLQEQIVLVGAMCFIYLLGRRFFPLYAIPVALLLSVLIAWYLDLFAKTDFTIELASFVFTSPTFSISSLISIGIPLFIVTMTSQNMPGIAVIKAADYHPPISPLITATGITGLVLAPFGGFAFNLAAITAAICMDEHADKNKLTRYYAAICAGVFYLLAALFGATIVALFSISPQALILPLAGLALLGTLGNSLAQALAQPKDREAALVTFLVTTSGITFLSIGSAFWAVVAGMIVQAFLRQQRKQ